MITYCQCLKGLQDTDTHVHALATNTTHSYMHTSETLSVLHCLASTTSAGCFPTT